MKTLPPPTDPWGDGTGQNDRTAKAAEHLAHEFNNILTVITGNLALAERHAAGNARLLRLLENMRIAGDRGIGLTQKLAALASGEGGAPLLGASEEAAPMTSRILVVEDDPQLGELASDMLKDLGHQVDLRRDATSALALLRDGPPFDLVFSDIVMPGGMNGIELAEQIATAFPRLPVLLATGYSAEALSPGALRFPVLAKPYSMRELSRRVAQMLPLAQMMPLEG